MATSKAANVVERVVGHRDQAETQQDVANPANNPEWAASGTMKALIWKGKMDVQLVDAPKPKIIEDDDVILKVTGATVCGSDLHLYNGVIPQLQTGDILGHEFCGRIDTLGPGVKAKTNLKPGQRVVASFQIACGDCRNCHRQLSAHCERANANKTINNLYGGQTGGIFGYSHLLGGFAGGQAEYVRVPWASVNLLPLPDDVPDEKGLFLSDVLCTAWHCVTDSGVKEGDTVAVWGGGPIGQMVCEMSFIKGAKRVILVDGPAGWRLEFVKSKVPKLETVDYTKIPKGNVTDKLKEMTDGVGPDVCLECAGGEYAKGWIHAIETAVGAEMDTSELLNEMVTSVKTFGTCGIIADYIGYTNHFNIGAVMERGIRLIGNGQAPVHRYWKQLLEMVQSGKLDPLHMVTHRVQLDEMETLYRKFHDREQGVQKVYVQTQFSDPRYPGSPELSSFVH